MSAQGFKWVKGLEAFVMIGVLATVIFTGWHVLLRHVPRDLYVLPHEPYVSVGTGSNAPIFSSLRQNMERDLIEFWRFGG